MEENTKTANSYLVNEWKPSGTAGEKGHFKPVRSRQVFRESWRVRLKLLWGLPSSSSKEKRAHLKTWVLVDRKNREKSHSTLNFYGNLLCIRLWSDVCSLILSHNLNDFKTWQGISQENLWLWIARKILSAGQHRQPKKFVLPQQREAKT